jgi:hypothetical protein
MLTRLVARGLSHELPAVWHPHPEPALSLPEEGVVPEAALPLEPLEDDTPEDPDPDWLMPELPGVLVPLEPEEEPLLVVVEPLDADVPDDPDPGWLAPELPEPEEEPLLVLVEPLDVDVPEEPDPD